MELNNKLKCDILIVGGGIAGLISAKKASESGKKVLLVINDKLGSGASYFELKGTLGIQSTAGEKDKKYFIEDIQNIGKGMENFHMIKTYIDEIENSIPYLKEIGFEPWLRADKRPACFAKYPRNIYLIKEWQKAREKAKSILSNIDNLKILENSELIQLIKKENKLVGAIVEKDEEFISISTPIVIMATGGVAGIYKNNLYPKKVFGSGHIILLDVGVKAQNMEFIQFIPAFIKPVYNTLFGEHTLKYCTGLYDLKNNLILEGIENNKLKDIWLERSGYAPFSFDFPSHIIDLKIFEEVENNHLGVKLTFSKELYEDKEEFYVVFLNWLKEKIGIDMCKDEIVIAPFAHSCNGGIKITENGETEVAGIFAVGELSSGVEGANRLGGNSMGASLVFGKRAVNSALKYLEENNYVNDENYLEESFKKWIESICQKDKEDILTYDEVKERLFTLMEKAGNISRDKENITFALKEVDKIRKQFKISKNLKKGLEIYFRIEVIKMLLLSMLERKESRGAHYRKDYPYTLDKIYKIEVSKSNDEFKLKKI